MGTYLMMLYVSVEQETALKDFFADRGWSYQKPDLSALTDKVGPPPPPLPEFQDYSQWCMPNQSSNISCKNTERRYSVDNHNDPDNSLNDDIEVDDAVPAAGDNVDTDGQDHGRESKEAEQDNVNIEEELQSTDIISCQPESSSPRKSVRLSKKRKVSWCNLTDKKIHCKTTSNGCLAKLSKETVKHRCDVCGLCFLSNNELIDHKSIDHHVLVVKEEEKSGMFDSIILECLMCKERFGDHADKENHYLKVHNVHSDSEIKLQQKFEELNNKIGAAEEQPEEVNDAHSESKKHELEISCSVCDSVFTSRCGFKAHCKKHEVSLHGPNMVQSHTCKYCNESFDKVKHYKAHLAGVHNEIFTKKTSLICDYCGKSFKRSDYLKLHIDTLHLGIRKRKSYIGHSKDNICEICGSKFKRKSHLEEHIAMKHNDNAITAHNCELCSKRFHRPSKLEYHLNKEHLHTKPFSCKHCNAQFYSQVTANAHMRICTMSEDSMKTCEHCGKKLKSNHNYKLHIQAVHSDPALVCACGKIVRWQSSVTKHKRRCPLNAVNLGEKMKRKLSKGIASQKKEIAIENIAVDTASIEPQPYQTKNTNEQQRIDGIQEVVAQIDPSTNILIETSDATGVNILDTDTLDEAVVGDIQCTVDEQIFTDLVNGVGEQVVEITSSPQQNTHSQHGNQNVYYVIMK